MVRGQVKAFVLCFPFFAISASAQIAEDNTDDSSTRSFDSQPSVFLRKRDDYCEALFIVGEKPRLIASAATPELLVEQLDAVSATKIDQLQGSYPVRIHSSGTIKRQYAPDLTLRSPTAGELLCLEYALERSLPVISQTKTKRLSVYFLKDRKHQHTIAEFELQQDGSAAIFVEPTGMYRKHELAHILIHELAHHSQYRLGIDHVCSGSSKLWKKLGWRTFWNHNAQDSGFLLLSYEGQTYRFWESADRWIKADTAGQFLDHNGARVRKPGAAQQLTKMQMAKRAFVRPATLYFNDPYENLAEAMMLFRFSSQSRTVLAQTSPQLYSMVKELDQTEIDKFFGPEKKVRSPDGLLLCATESQLENIAAFERTSERLSMLSTSSERH